MANTKRYSFTSESVTEGHPDKICDQISDAVLDAVLTSEAEAEKVGYISPSGVAASLKNARSAIECYTTTGIVVIGGELRTSTYVDVQTIARETLREIGYDRAKYGFDCDTCSVVSVIHEQSPDIAQGVDESYEVQKGEKNKSDYYDNIGAGDQGIMFGYATDETPELMPLPIHLAHRLALRLTEVRKDGTLDYLRPDGKTQVTVGYEDGKAVEVEKVLISTQHAEDIDIDGQLKPDLIEHVIKPILQECDVPSDNASVLVNPTGRFVIGGPMGDTGLTGRKIIVDTYGGSGRHGGGAFSGKDATKVDRSATYAARWIAKNVVAAGLAKRIEIQLSYAIGVSAPQSIFIDTFGTGTVSDDVLIAAIEKVFDLRPAAIIDELDLRRPIFRKTAAYGHFGRELDEFTWEKTNKIDELRAAVGA